MRQLLSRLLIVIVACLLARLTGALPVMAADPARPLPIKVFILAGQSNMEGQAVSDLSGKDYNEGRGTLNALLHDPAKTALVRHLREADGKWTVRDDVWCRYRRERGKLLAGPLTMGFSVYGDGHHFGPELQFGHVLGEHFENPVLLIKAAWGGKSLYKDFRPPSSGGEVGPYYTTMIAEVREAIENLKSDFPSLADRETELAGFVWYHGWNDGVDPKNAVPQYEQNLVNLINDVRKEFNAPKLPVVVGELTGPWVEAPGAWGTLRKAQAAAADRPEFHGNVVFIETHDFVRKPEESPNPTHGHHEFGNAETYFLVGDALGKGMVSLLNGTGKITKPAEAKSDPPQPASRTARELEGWTIRVDDRLMDTANQELSSRALKFLEAKLVEIKAVVPTDRLKALQEVTIVLDLSCGKLRSMQYHPSAGWLEENGFPADLAKCVHLPRAADLATRRNINEQPWVILHELAHAFHDQKLSFDEPRIKEAHEKFKQSGHGDATLLYNGRRVKHYALTNQMEFFAEMTESYFGVNDFFPFNRAELKEAEPELFELLAGIWNPQQGDAATKPITFTPIGNFPKLPSDYELGPCSAVATNSKGEIYLFHRGPHPILCVDADGKLLRSWGDGEIGKAHGIRVDHDDNVWVTDIGRHRVLKFDPAGKLLLALGTGKPGKADDEFNQPTDLAFAPNGDVFVSDGYGNSRVVKFTAAGRFLKSWGTKGKEAGEFNLPHSLLIDSKGRLLVGDRENNRIQIFDLEGKFLEQWTGFAPFGLALNGDGQVFVADARAHQILLLDEFGKAQQRWGQKGTALGEFQLPHMLAFDKAGNLFVAEVEGKRFQRLRRK